MSGARQNERKPRAVNTVPYMHCVCTQTVCVLSQHSIKMKFYCKYSSELRVNIKNKYPDLANAAIIITNL